jgi:two-component system response regulator VicR
VYYKPVVYAIDDDKVARNIYQKTLSDDFSIHTFERHEELIKAVKSLTPDLLICDLVMPWLDGWAVIDLLKELKVTFPIIVATSLSGKEYEVACDFNNVSYWCKVTGAVKLKELIKCLMRPPTSN